MFIRTAMLTMAVCLIGTTAAHAQNSAANPVTASAQEIFERQSKYIAGAAEECQSATTALRRAEVLSRAAGHIGAVAFSRSGDPMMGEFSDAKLLKAYGNVPSDLSEL